MENNKKKIKRVGWMILGIVIGVFLVLIAFVGKNFLFVGKNSSHVPVPNKEIVVAQHASYYIHRNISSTFFWAGERAGFANSYIPNSASAWDSFWKEHYGGLDSPQNRNGFYPGAFVPKENPFYFALPYNDMDSAGQRKKESFDIIPWANDRQWSDRESMCKNQWVKIMKGDNAVYAQWEDVGPYGETDGAYVFGNAEPASNKNESAGIDVSPAVRDYLKMADIDDVDWQFIDFKDVPDGPWKEIITTSQINWQ